MWPKPSGKAWQFMNATCKPKFDSLDALEAELQEMGPHSQEYWDKQVHVVPQSKTVEREKFILDRCTGKTVLHIGCTGPLDAAMRKVAKRCYGIDKEPSERTYYAAFDLDRCAHGIDPAEFPRFPDVEIIVCGEVLEHLSNPGRFLDFLHVVYDVPVIFTVPNAFSSGSIGWLKRGYENVNVEHVAWYSWHTIKILLKRHGYEISDFFWYGGNPLFSEGLIVVCGNKQPDVAAINAEAFGNSGISDAT